MHFTSALKVSAILVNIGAFVFAAIVLYDLSRRGRLDISTDRCIYFHVAQKYVVILLFFSPKWRISILQGRDILLFQPR